MIGDILGATGVSGAGTDDDGGDPFFAPAIRSSSSGTKLANLATSSAFGVMMHRRRPTGMSFDPAGRMILAR